MDNLRYKYKLTIESDGFRRWEKDVTVNAGRTIEGTGSEDYFNDAWGFRRRSGLWFGQGRWQGDEVGDSGAHRNSAMATERAR